MNDSSLAQGGRKIYLENIPREEALSRLLEKVGAFRLGEEEIATTEALGRVTARGLRANFQPALSRRRHGRLRSRLG
jgi:molybdopterin biosynthesis enzyme